MDVLTKDQHRALAFIAAANFGGYAPVENEVDKWLSEPQPENTYAALQKILTKSKLLQPNKTVTSHLIQIGWVRKDNSTRLSLTGLGEALLRHAESQEIEGVTVVMLDDQDPLAYAHLIGALAEVGKALIVDPYLDLKGVHDLLEHTQVTRALIKDGAPTQRNQSAIAQYLSGEEDPLLEVRVASSGLHDRFILADDGRVWTIGASMNGIAKRKATTVLTPMPNVVAAELSKQLESQWLKAKPLLSPEKTEQSDEAKNEEK